MVISEIQEKLEEYYAEQLAGAAGVTISEVSHIDAGWESDIYAYRATNHEGASKALILRLYPGADGDIKSDREFFNLRQLNRLNYPVPEAYHRERDTNLFGSPFIIIDRIPGQTLWGPLFSATDIDQIALIDSFSKLFAHLHSLDYTKFISTSAGVNDVDPNSLIKSQVRYWRSFYDAHPLPDFLPLFDWLRDYRLEKSFVRPAVLHWDFHPENIILKPDGGMVVIDWTGMQVSDPRFDLAWTLLLITTYEGKQWRQPFLEAYEHNSGQIVEQMDFFEAAACTRRLFSILVSLTSGAEKLGMRPGAEERMKSQIKPAQRVYMLLQELTGIRLPIVEEAFFKFF